MLYSVVVLSNPKTHLFYLTKIVLGTLKPNLIEFPIKMFSGSL